MMRFKSLLAVILLSVCHVPLAIAAQGELHVRSVYTNPGGKLLVVVELPQGLAPKASDFHLLIDNKSVAPATAIRGQDVDVTLLVDISGSMKGPPINDAKAALLSLVGKEARPKDRFKLASFADKYTVLSELNQSRQDLVAAINGLAAPGRMTKLYQALYESLGNEQDVDPDTRRVFIVISDGKDEGSDETMLDKVFARSKDSGVPIHAVFRGRIEKQFGDVLSGLAHATGGIYRPADNEIKLKASLNEIYHLETRSFLVSFTYDRDPSGKTTDAAAIELRPAAGSPMRDKISVAIPLASVPVAPPVVPPVVDNKSYPIWLLLSVVSLLLIAAIVIWRRREKPAPIDIPPTTEKVFIDTSEPEPMVAPRRGHEPTLVIIHRFAAPKPGQPTAMLIGVQGPAEGQQYSMESEVFRIGAGADNDLSIGQDDYVSTQHAYLRYEKGSLFIFDQSSRNGTFVNESKVQDTGLVLRPGDRFRIGMSVFEVGIPS